MNVVNVDIIIIIIVKEKAHSFIIIRFSEILIFIMNDVNGGNWQ